MLEYFDLNWRTILIIAVIIAIITIATILIINSMNPQPHHYYVQVSEGMGVSANG